MREALLVAFAGVQDNDTATEIATGDLPGKLLRGRR